MNKFILTSMRWLADHSSVSQEVLKHNKMDSRALNHTKNSVANSIAAEVAVCAHAGEAEETKRIIDYYFETTIESRTLYTTKLSACLKKDIEQIIEDAISGRGLCQSDKQPLELLVKSLVEFIENREKS